jgi:DNA-binding SARP family transcriptional activator
MEAAPQLLLASPQRETAPSEEVSHIRVHLLGPFSLIIGGRNVASGMPGQVQTVLKYVLSQGGHPVSKDALLDLLWPETDPAVTGSRLRVLMHTLRRGVPCDALGFRDFLVLSGSNFSVNSQARLWIDVDNFEQSWHAGWRLQRSGDTAAALKEYERAEALYKGDYLEDDPYADWTLLRREALRDAYSTILTMLASMSLEAGDYTGAIIWAQKLLSQDNCREDAYRFLMMSHQRLGQTGRANHWYNMCVRTLARELGMEPSPETQILHHTMSESAPAAHV